MSYLRVSGFNKTYGDNPVFIDISFSLEKGEFVTLLGPSGCGIVRWPDATGGIGQVAGCTPPYITFG